MLSGDLKFTDNSFCILLCSSDDNSFDEINFALSSPLFVETKLRKLSIIFSKKNNLFFSDTKPKNLISVSEKLLFFAIENIIFFEISYLPQIYF